MKEDKSLKRRRNKKYESRLKDKIENNIPRKKKIKKRQQIKYSKPLKKRKRKENKKKKQTDSLIS